MGLFSRRIRGSEDAREVLATAIGLLGKNGSSVSIRGTVSQAMKNLKFGQANIGDPGEVSVSKELISYGGINPCPKSLEALESWGSTAEPPKVRAAFESAFECLGGGRG